MDAELAECQHRLDTLRLSFHDLESPQPDLPEAKLFTHEDSRSILRFVEKNRSSVRLIVCHCDAGMSRSAGVAAALSRWLQDEDSAFFRHYVPNRLVYDTLLATLGSKGAVR
jgi:predicted protein tyrosine phosphatase